MEPAEIARRASEIHLPQARLARLAGVNPNTVGRMFKGRRDCWRLTNTNVAAALVAEEKRILAHLIALHGVPTEQVPA